MSLFDGMKIKKLEQNLELDGLVDLMNSGSQSTYCKACDAFLRTSMKVRKLSDKSRHQLMQLTKHKNFDLQTKAWQSLLRTGDPLLMESIVEYLETNSTGPVAKMAYSYFDTVREKEPDRIRSSMTANNTVREMVYEDLRGEVSLTDPRVQRAYRFVELFGMWEEAEIAEKTMKYVEGDLKDVNPVLADMLLDAMVRVYPRRMANLLIRNWQSYYNDTQVGEKMIERIKGIGKPALPVLMEYITAYRSGIETQRTKATTRSPEFEISKWCVYLIGELAKLADEQVIDFLAEIVVDTKLSDTGPHRKNAREALTKIRESKNE